mgnify:CR=1 FL=1
MRYEIYEEVDRVTWETTIRFVEITDHHTKTGKEFECDISEIDKNRRYQIHTFSEVDLNSGFEHKRILHRLLGSLNYAEIIELYFGL